MPAIDTENLLFIVTGVHLTAEVGDRPLAYRIEGEVKALVGKLFPATACATAAGVRARLTPVVVSDAYFINNEEIQDNPVISVGGPGVNALSAMLYDKLATPVAIENTLVIQMDLEGEDMRCALWGMTHLDTIRAVEVFVSKGYLETFVRNAGRLMGEGGMTSDE